ncbi:MAG: hypothetical protein NTX07_07500 [Solirubrobacterales bacterium]|nr:hypothetical protein [Solirubrobacterales bacterium]
MSRPVRIALIVALGAVFIVVSLGVGRVLGARGAERVLVEQVIRDQASGNVQGIARELPNCGLGTKCHANVVKLLAKVSGPGLPLEILQITQAAGVSPGGSTGVARIAWHIGSRLPVVECLVIQKTGNVVSGFGVHLIKLSNPIAREGACPGVPNLLV